MLEIVTCKNIFAITANSCISKREFLSEYFLLWYVRRRILYHSCFLSVCMWRIRTLYKEMFILIYKKDITCYFITVHFGMEIRLNKM